jgi:hypothetical protein
MYRMLWRLPEKNIYNIAMRATNCERFYCGGNGRAKGVSPEISEKFFKLSTPHRGLFLLHHYLSINTLTGTVIETGRL